MQVVILGAPADRMTVFYANLVGRGIFERVSEANPVASKYFPGDRSKSMEYRVFGPAHAVEGRQL